MAKTTNGIAIGLGRFGSGLDNADIALMADRLDNLPFAIGKAGSTSELLNK